MDKIPESIKEMFKSVAPLLIVLILSLIVGRFGISKIGDIRSQVKTATTTQNTLKQKVSILQSVTATISDSTNAAAVALPDSNTSLAVISQLKNLAVVNTLLMTNIKSGSEVKDSSGLSKVDVSFKIDGQKEQIINFLKNVSTLAPMIKISRLKLSQSQTTASADVVATSYWASLPKTLPTSTQTLNGLTSDEVGTLTTVSSLTPPIFIQITPSSGGKTDPFANPQ